MNRNTSRTIPTPAMLAALGAGAVAYIKPLMSEDAAKLFPQAASLKPGIQLFTLNAADGTPIMLADSVESAVANAWEKELITVAVH
jgi:hypothetical protein